jgi:hypothetical protein
MNSDDEIGNKYDAAIQYLTEHPEEIHKAWITTKSHAAGCLFSFLEPSGTFFEYVGCPTLIKRGDYVSFENKMDEFVRSMDIPSRSRDIKVEHLPLFKLIQEEADEVYHRL